MNTKKAPKYFTRHLLRAGLQCPAKLYYKSHRYPENSAIRPFLEHAGFNKYQLKKLATLHYSDAIFIDKSSRNAAAELTATCLKKENTTLLEAAFIANRCYAKVPVLIKENREITLVDIQTKAINPYKHRLVNHHDKLYKKWKPYIVDLAYKMYCIRELYPGWTYKAELLLPDKTKKANNDHLLYRLQNGVSELRDEDLFCTLDVTDHVHKMLSEDATVESFKNQKFETVIEDFKTRLFTGDWTQPDIGKKCGNCEFRILQSQIDKGAKSGFEHCWKGAPEVPDYSRSEAPVLDLIGPGVNNWLNDGVFLQKDILLDDLPPLQSITTENSGITQKQRQTLQVRQAKGLEVPTEIVKQPIIDEIDRWEFPLHFLDFEAGNYSVPLRKNRSPYHLLVFQFSCHTLHADGSRTHNQWINADPEQYPNYELIRQLMEVPDIQQGSIIQYSKFEHYALKTIRKELNREFDMVDDAGLLVKWLDGIVQRHDSNHHSPPYLADMSRLVKSYYYNCYMEDSLSIKDVLQSILTVSKTLKKKYNTMHTSSNFDGIQWWQWDEAHQRAKSPYEILKSTQQQAAIGRGTEAMVTYARFLSGSLEEKETAFDALLKYCELDTLAMVMIYEHWNGWSKTTK